MEKEAVSPEWVKNKVQSGISKASPSRIQGALRSAVDNSKGTYRKTISAATQLGTGSPRDKKHLLGRVEQIDALRGAVKGIQEPMQKAAELDEVMYESFLDELMKIASGLTIGSAPSAPKIGPGKMNVNQAISGIKSEMAARKPGKLPFPQQGDVMMKHSGMFGSLMGGGAPQQQMTPAPQQQAPYRPPPPTGALNPQGANVMFAPKPRMGNSPNAMQPATVGLRMRPQ